MLQVISGRFFLNAERINEQECDAILYSNYWWVTPIKAGVAELRPADNAGASVSSYVMRYTNRYQPASENDIRVLPNAVEAVEQFRLLASFYFKAFFHNDRDYVERLCRPGAMDGFDKIVPSQFVSGFFDGSRRGEAAQSVEFARFLDKVLAMPRKGFRLLLSCLSAFFDALEVLGNNFDLAYSMLVYMLEALSKSAPKPSLAWADFDQDIRESLDRHLVTVDSVVAESIRSELIKNPHLKLKKRFTEFILAHVRDDYFTSEAKGIKWALPKSSMRRAIGNLYDARSGYVHELKRVHDQLRHSWAGANSDVFVWENETSFTFDGLVRLSRHVLNSFISKQPVLEGEECGWRSEIPGTVQLEMSPEYWAWIPDSFQPANARKRFNGFVQHLMTHIQEENPALLDLRKVMLRIEQLVPNAKSSERVPMLALYVIFNSMIRVEDQRPDWVGFAARWKSEVEKCSIEWMVKDIFIGSKVNWSTTEWIASFDEYQRSMHKPTATKLPLLLEVAIVAEISNRLLESDDGEARDKWLERGTLDAAGNSRVQDYLIECRRSRNRVDINQLLGRPSPALSSEKPQPTVDEVVEADEAEDK